MLIKFYNNQMDRYHICGINLSSINTYNYLKKKKIKVTISDIKDKLKINKKFLKKINKKDIFFGLHPSERLARANKVIISSGFIKKEKEYKNYIKNNKYISELEIFYKFKDWKKSNILLVTGSKGKTTLCKKILKILKQTKKYKNIYYIDRKKYTFSNIPESTKKSFLIVEIDYQTLLIAKSLKAKYRISSSFSYTQNKAFENNKLYLTAKRKIKNGLEENDILILDHSSKMNFNFSKKSVVNIRKCDIKKKNNLIVKNIIPLIKKNFDE